ncbi:hypothetical protein Q0Z83_034820 [Actinoplanes sichuanensis]|uniref:N-acetyltransferase domain-containing protein n=1 Tax=Actinoplanes sichuanensis TaxID=512349 RepID=A0ABW4AAH3_9ACTN|nr:hypothetical protein [Actinoplanes sichuanensis]BEL05291.1 hypothetical protein Q0Z83_034820 [Actinoplanes sichuanensis]
MDIRDCTAEDLDRLEEWLPTGRPRVHAARFARQVAGVGSFIIAWAADGPAGSGEVRWDGPKEQAVRAAFDGPEINGLQVWPPARRGPVALPRRRRCPPRGVGALPVAGQGRTTGPSVTVHIGRSAT